MSEEIVLKRIAQSEEHGTFGVLIKGDRPLCVTLEDPWRNNRVGESCIPVGTYFCVRHNGPKYKNVWILQHVPGRSDILIHWGNTQLDTRGCLLAASKYGKLGPLYGILESKKAFGVLNAELPDQFNLTIRSCI